MKVNGRVWLDEILEELEGGRMDEEREREGRESLKEDWMERFFGGGEGLEKVRVIIIWTNENSE